MEVQKEEMRPYSKHYCDPTWPTLKLIATNASQDDRLRDSFTQTPLGVPGLLTGDANLTCVQWERFKNRCAEHTLMPRLWYKFANVDKGQLFLYIVGSMARSSR